jgi:hypothetical protein
MAQLVYDTRARLVRYDGDLKKAGTLVAGLVKHGPLGDLVREVVTRPVRELWRYAITVDGAPEGATSDIFLLASRLVCAPRRS